MAVMKKPSKIYLAGHTGMVGSALHRGLQKRGYKNIVVRSRKQMNLLDQVVVERFFKKEKPEFVIIAAAKVGGIKANMEFQADFLYENLQIQNNIIWNAHLNDVKKLLFFSSSCVYPRSAPQPMKEEYMLDAKPEPTNEGYAIAKISGMKLCEMLKAQYGKDFISCIPTNLYGPKDNFDLEHAHVVPSLLRKYHEAKEKDLSEIVAWGSGSPKREFLYSEDLVDAAIFLMTTPTKYDTVNIGTGKEVTIKELTELIKDVVGYKGKITWDTSKPDGNPRKLMDVSRMREAGWEAKVLLEDGLRSTYEWYKRNYR